MLLNGSEAASEEFDAPTEQLRNHDFRNSRITNSANIAGSSTEDFFGTPLIPDMTCLTDLLE